MDNLEKWEERSLMALHYRTWQGTALQTVHLERKERHSRQFSSTPALGCDPLATSPGRQSAEQAVLASMGLVRSQKSLDSRIGTKNGDENRVSMRAVGLTTRPGDACHLSDSVTLSAQMSHGLLSDAIH